MGLIVFILHKLDGHTFDLVSSNVSFFLEVKPQLPIHEQLPRLSRPKSGEGAKNGDPINWKLYISICTANIFINCQLANSFVQIISVPEMSPTYYVWTFWSKYIEFCIDLDTFIILCRGLFPRGFLSNRL